MTAGGSGRRLGGLPVAKNALERSDSDPLLAKNFAHAAGDRRRIGRVSVKADGLRVYFHARTVFRQDRAAARDGQGLFGRLLGTRVPSDWYRRSAKPSAATGSPASRPASRSIEPACPTRMSAGRKRRTASAIARATSGNSP